LENKLISKCAAKHILERPQTTNRATPSNRCAATNSRGKGSHGGGGGGKGSHGEVVKEAVMVVKKVLKNN
jgi:hypothetical protein